MFAPTTFLSPFPQKAYAFRGPTMKKGLDIRKLIRLSNPYFLLLCLFLSACKY